MSLISKTDRFRILARDRFTCRYCGRSAPAVQLEVDHRTPRCQGGDNGPDNLVAACLDCNRGKGGRLLPSTHELDDAQSTLRTAMSLWICYALETMTDQPDDEIDESVGASLFLELDRVSPGALHEMLDDTRAFVLSTPQPRMTASRFLADRLMRYRMWKREQPR